MFNYELGQTAYKAADGGAFLITQRRERTVCPEPEYCNQFGTWLKQSELVRQVTQPELDKGIVLNIPRAAGRSALHDFYSQFILDGPLGQSNKARHNAAVKATLEQRGKQYTPAEGRSQIQAVMNDALMKALRPLLPAGCPAGSDFIITMMVGKLTRAIEGGLNGQYEGDNGLDLSGYEACLTARVLGCKPEEVIK